MNRSSRPASSAKNGLLDSFTRLFADNPVLFIGMAFDLGLMLGDRTGKTMVGRKVRKGASDLADQVVTLAPDSVANLVPDLLPAKSRRASPRKKSARKKRAKEPAKDQAKDQSDSPTA